MKVLAMILVVGLGVDGAVAQGGMPEAIVPRPRQAFDWWMERHEKKIEEAAGGGHELVFIGDSITQGWEEKGRNVWEEHYGKRKALNLGFSGDRTEHVLWRLKNGELEHVSPKLFVLLIGTNNTGQGRDSPEEAARGIGEILELLKRERPKSKVLLLPVFPRGGLPDGRLRKINREVNALTRPMADGKRVIWLDLTGVFLNDEGILTVRVMPDGLHLSKHGYGLWARAMEPTIERLLK